MRCRLFFLGLILRVYYTQLLIPPGYAMIILSYVHNDPNSKGMITPNMRLFFHIQSIDFISSHLSYVHSLHARPTSASASPSSINIYIHIHVNIN